MTGAQIRIAGARFSYGDANPALADVTLDIHAGEHVCVLGGNGSGKSTLLQLMNALLLADEGEVRMFGLDPTQPGAALEIRRRAAMVFQHPEDQMVTSIVADDVAFGPENLGVPTADIARRVDAALEAVDMAAFAQADPADLSGGQRQRVAIAGALAMEPRVLLLDEPAAMLDDEGRRAIQDIIARLHEQGITIVHVTHFMDDALAADRVLVMDAGRIVLDGAPNEVFSQHELMERLGLELPFAYRVERHIRSLTSGEGAGVCAGRGGCAPGCSDTVASYLRSSSTSADAGPLAAGQRANQVGSPSPQQDCSSSNPPGPAAGTGGLLEEPVKPLALHRATFSYARNAGPAVSSLSFSLAPGTLTALVGRTGSGKSTTAELACALKLPQEGTVSVAGIPTADLKRRRELRAQIGYVSQLPERQLFAPTVYDDIAFGPRNLGLAEEEVHERVHAALAAVGLAATDSLLARSPFALSGGQQRSVALAGILAMRQPILVLDEPMAGLDPAGRAHVRRILDALKRDGATLLLVTHSMDDAAELADRVIALDGGRIVADGTPREVFARALDEPDIVPGLPSALVWARDHGLPGPPERAPLTLDELAVLLTLDGDIHREVTVDGAPR